MQKSEKSRERIFLDIVLSADEMPTPSNIIARERPDFLFEYSTKNVGVELSQLYRQAGSRGSKRWEGACEGVLEAARRCWDARSLPSIHVSVTFNKEASFKKPSWPSWGERLSNLVQQILPQPGQQAVAGIGAEPAVTSMPLPSELRSIIVERIEQPGSRWTLSTGGAVRPLRVDVLQHAITAKERHVQAYRSVAPVLWLIIALDRFRYSSHFGLRDSEAVDAKYATSFDRLFLVPRGHREFYELDRGAPDHAV